ncbi:hypothetical protein EDC04DRAFT_2668015, partial [Pisolithus marmoratus]
MTTYDLPLDKQQKSVLAHPWISYIHGLSGRATWGMTRSLILTLTWVWVATLGWMGLCCCTLSLGQPFNALLLAQQPNGERKRVLSEHEIAVLGTRDKHHPQEHLDKSPGNLVMRGYGLGLAVGFTVRLSFVLYHLFFFSCLCLLIMWQNLLCAFGVPVIRFAWGGDSESDTDRTRMVTLDWIKLYL